MESATTPSAVPPHPPLRLLFEARLSSITYVGTAPFAIVGCTPSPSPSTVFRDDEDGPALPVVASCVPVREVYKYGRETMEVCAVVLQISQTSSTLSTHSVYDGSRSESTKEGEEEQLSCYIATLWGLTFDTAYDVRISRVVNGEITLTANEAKPLVAFTMPFTMGVSLPRNLQRCYLSAPILVKRPDFVEMVCAQRSREALLSITVSSVVLEELELMLPWLCYHGLFAVPVSTALSVKGGQAISMISYPNPSNRFIIDLQLTTLVQTTASNAAGGEGTEGGGEPVASRTTITPHAIPWRRSVKVRRLIQSGSYAVVVREGEKEMEAALLRAADYHASKRGATWLYPEIRTAILRSCSASPPSTGTEELGLRFMAVELVRRDSGEVMAGCCGYAVGTVYCDYTMYTLAAQKESFGMVVTKLVGEALQQCGYDFWYWGACLEYMKEYKGRYGGRDVPRAEFYKRWERAKKEAPKRSLPDFLKANCGMLPYVDGAASAAL